MTGYTVHTGSTIKFSNSWDRIFSGPESERNSVTSKKKAVDSTKMKSKKASSKKAVARLASPKSVKKPATPKKVAKGGKKKV